MRPAGRTSVEGTWHSACKDRLSRCPKVMSELDRYTLVVRARGGHYHPRRWSWEICRDGEPLPARLREDGFATEYTATAAGNVALRCFLAGLREEDREALTPVADLDSSCFVLDHQGQGNHTARLTCPCSRCRTLKLPSGPKDRLCRFYSSRPGDVTPTRPLPTGLRDRGAALWPPAFVSIATELRSAATTTRKFRDGLESSP
jgi:hypothetical protein